MKSVIIFVCCAGLWAQVPSPARPPQAPPPPPAIPAPAPQPQVVVPPDTVVAEVDGKKYTAAEVTKLIQIFPPQMAAAVRSDLKRALNFVLVMNYMASEAEKAKLDQASPLKETLEYQRLNALMQAEINQVRNYQFNPSPGEEEQYYKEHPDKYEEAKLKVIYVTFSANPPANPAAGAKKPLTEAEAKAKTEELRKKLVAGADFAELAKENSDDKESAGKGGDFPPLKRSSAYADAIKQAVFSLKPGEISEPLRQPNGFYLIRLEEKRTPPFAEIRTQLYEELKTKEFNDWMQALQKRYEVKVENPAYFASKPAAAPPFTPAPHPR